ncbi:uncharacterized protein LOC106129319 [Amyelois transitella]|uniref:uncharacterized protein LOC106129319 n=1 Tax=Amyelois transitella TaxID=680683 RepID=UPI00298F96EE|nr:uncharacterized protein LOC106129319 [Amyelois transitella]
MHSKKKSTDTKSKNKLSKEEVVITSKDEKKKVAVTPRNYLQKASTTDIYGQKNTLSKAPRKIQGTTKTSSSSPMKNLLKSSASSISQISKTSTTSLKDKEAKPMPYSGRKLKDEPKKSTLKLARDFTYSNVTVNSPSVKRKLDLGEKIETVKMKNFESSHAQLKKKLEPSEKENATGRDRTKTRTLQENEVKVLTPDVVDNNAEMMKLTQKLTAKPKAFYVDIDDGEAKALTDKLSDEEISYEDDFESYESDFDSYHSSQSEQNSNNDHSEENSDNAQSDFDEHNSQNSKENEEKMLDSGNFELRDSQRSASHTKSTLDFIQEDGETDIKVSLTDEGFQEMSCSSTASSMKTVHVDILERPLFIDFNKAKENKRKHKIFENLKQRVKDILSMVTLHEMSYTLFEMKPIPYDSFMVTFGRSNYRQTGVQTYEDGISEEVQTNEIEVDQKWTQYPIEFSKHYIYLKDDIIKRKYSLNSEDYFSKFTLLIKEKADVYIHNEIYDDVSYRNNPLRIYFEQRNGAGNSEILPYETYKSKLRNSEFNTNKLRLFLKRVERRICHVLSLNSCDQELTDIAKSSKFSFSKGYFTLSNRNITDEKPDLVNCTKITNIVFSDSRSNLIMTIHEKSPSFMGRCISCLWDISIARHEPMKILTAIDNITVARFRGNTNGIFAAALEDGSIHLWDLSEEATWQNDASDKRANDLAEVGSNTPLTQTEKDREWNLLNSNVGSDGEVLKALLQACSFTSSAAAMNGVAPAGRVVGIELGWHAKCEGSQRRKVLGQVCSLQDIGILSIWLIIQDKLITSKDMGKAYWSKMKLEISQTISLMNHLSGPNFEPLNADLNSNFNLSSAKRRLSLRKKNKTNIFSPKSAGSVESVRPKSAVSIKTNSPTKNNWDTGIICTDLKIMNYDNTCTYLVAKNCGEVLSCSKVAGDFKVNELRISNDTSTVTSLEVSSRGLPYFLAATDSGTVNLCSVKHSRVLLTLDCRNRVLNKEVEKFHAHRKGHFVGSVTIKSPGPTDILNSSQFSISTVLWSAVNPCSIFAILKDGCLFEWDLTHSDINAKCAVDNAATAGAAADGVLALVNVDGEVQIHRVGNEAQAKQHTDLFSKYAALL